MAKIKREVCHHENCPCCLRGHWQHEVRVNDPVDDPALTPCPDCQLAGRAVCVPRASRPLIHGEDLESSLPRNIETYLATADRHMVEVPE